MISSRSRSEWNCASLRCVGVGMRVCFARYLVSLSLSVRAQLITSDNSLPVRARSVSCVRLRSSSQLLPPPSRLDRLLPSDRSDHLRIIRAFIRIRSDFGIFDGSLGSRVRFWQTQLRDALKWQPNHDQVAALRNVNFPSNSRQ